MLPELPYSISRRPLLPLTGTLCTPSSPPEGSGSPPPLKEQYGKDLFQLVSSSRLLLINNLVVEHSIDRDQQLIEKLLNQALHTLGDVSLVYAEELGSEIVGDSRESGVLAREASMRSIERFVAPLPLSFWHAL